MFQLACELTQSELPMSFAYIDAKNNNTTEPYNTYANRTVN